MADARDVRMIARVAVENRILKADGTVVDIAPEVQPNILALGKLVTGSRSAALDTVSLRHFGYPQLVMLVDDLGHAKGLPINERATALYLANCIVGAEHVVRGDVAIVRDDLFEA